MPALAYHITIRLQDDRAITQTVGDRRKLSALVYLGGSRHGLLGFRVADTHAHLLFRCDRKVAGQSVRAIEVAIQHSLRPGAGFEPARIREVRDQHHLRSSLRYLFRQEQHHRLTLDPFHEGSSLPELIGLRSLPKSTGWEQTASRVRAVVPRLRRAELVEILGESVGQSGGRLSLAVFSQPLAGLSPGVERSAEAWLAGAVPGDGPGVETVLREAVSAAAGITALSERGRQASLARCAAVALLGATWSPARLAALLEISPRTLHRLRTQSAPLELVRATALQIAMRRKPAPDG
jgi:hypothetical protein